MSSRLLAFALLAALGSVLVMGRPGHARAQTIYTPDSLSALLLTTDQVNLAVSPDQHVTDVSDGSPQSDTVIRVVRLIKTDLGITAITLFANADGSPPTSDEQNAILSGQYLNGLAGAIFSDVSNFTLGGSTGAADADTLALFTGNLNGASWDSIGDAFIKGNVFGAILYTTPLQADGGLLGVLLGLQLANIPR